MKKIVVFLMSIFLMHLGNAMGLEQDFQSSSWIVYRNSNAMTDKVYCLAVLKDRPYISARSHSFTVDASTRGGVRNYTIRIDDYPAMPMQFPNHIEREVNAVIFKNEFNLLLNANRLRVQILTILNSVIDEDIDLTGFSQSIEYMRENNC